MKSANTALCVQTKVMEVLHNEELQKGLTEVKKVLQILLEQANTSSPSSAVG